jgi:hypothetical protein
MADNKTFKAPFTPAPTPAAKPAAPTTPAPAPAEPTKAAQKAPPPVDPYDYIDELKAQISSGSAPVSVGQLDLLVGFMERFPSTKRTK